MKFYENDALTFADVLLRPGYSKLSSRLEADYTIDAFGYKNLAPIMVANMIDLATPDMWKAMASLRIIVPFNRINRTVEERLEEVKYAVTLRTEYDMPVAAAVGLNDRDAICKLESYVDVMFLDVAYAYTEKILEEIDWIKRLYDKYLVVGNVATGVAAKDLTSLGVDFVKTGVGSGSPCSTRIITGCGVSQLSAIIECSEESEIIADGGIRNSADATKALAAGASFVMCGGVFAGTDETLDDGTGTKIYRGLASSDANANKRGIVPEGISAHVPNKGPAERIAKNLLAGIRQGMGLVGAKNLTELRDKAVFQRVSHATTIENSPHIKL